MEQDAGPHPERTPALRDPVPGGVVRRLIEVVRPADRVAADPVDDRELVSDPASPQQDGRGGPWPDAGKGLELREGLVDGETAEAFRV